MSTKLSGKSRLGCCAACGISRMTSYLIIIPTLCYLAAALAYAWQTNWPMAIVYSGYAWANMGLWWLDRMVAGH